MTVPDAEALTGTYLRSIDALADIVGSRIVGDTPRDTTDAWVRVTQIDDAPLRSSRALHLVTVWLQFDCYAGTTGGHEQASGLSRLVREHLNAMNTATHAGAVVSGVKFGGTHRLPDTDFQPARERFVFTAEITLHAA